MNRHEFIGNAIEEMVENGVSINIAKRTNRSKYSDNYFDADKITHPIFIMNCFDEQFDFTVFIHEYAHFCQWKKKSPLWTLGSNAYDNLGKWQAGKRKKISLDDLRNIQKLEIDADKKVIQFNQKYNFEIDESYYIKSSNSYVLTYQFVYDQETFKNYPYHYADSDILDLMPNTPLTSKQLDNKWEDVMRLFAEKRD